MFIVKIIAGKKEISAELSAPARLTDLFHDNNVPFDMPCAGRGKCLKCKVRAKGALSQMTELEKKALSQDELSGGVRLACMTFAHGDAEIVIDSGEGASRIVSGGHMPEFDKNPVGKKFGLAADIGTTTVAAYLYDLKTCALLSSTSAENPQRSFGADVISRIEKSLAGDGEKLARCIADCIKSLAQKMCREAQISPEDIDSAVITGNTTMLYLLTNKNVDCLSHAPFSASTLFGNSADNSFSLPGFANADVFLPRCMSAFVGADITTAVLSSGMTDQNSCSLLCDIGTNGEMALWFNGKLYCCSTAAGPAFEGVGIHMGMSACDGAVDRVYTDSKTITVTTVGNAPARGICGSGIIDAAAVLAQCGIIDETGAFQKDGHAFSDCVIEMGGEPAFRFSGTGIVVTQKDIREIQLAKSAIKAGILTLLHKAGITPADFGTFYIAGGFGNYINIESAVRIGMFPREVNQKAKVLGNAAGMGACMILLSGEMKEKSENIAQEAQTVELSTDPYFMDTYIDSMEF